MRTDCKQFNGYKPCRPHKEDGRHCDNCSEYAPQGPVILVIKLRAAGEVIRNTPLIHKILQAKPNAQIFWLTEYPDLVPVEAVYKVLKWGFESATVLQDVEFDTIYSLDKDLDACALANKIKSRSKKGFTQKNGTILPFDEDARPKWECGIFDDLMRENKKHYVEEIFKICGFKFNDEKYWLPKYRVPALDVDTHKKVVVLNTGAGEAWRPRRYSLESWGCVARALIDQGREVILAGGPAEDGINKRISQMTGAKYYGTFSYLDFIGLLSIADVIATSISFAFHVAVGLGKPVVALNNTFNRNEFYMYGKGEILEPNLPCLNCYKNDFDETCVTKNCMDLIKPLDVVSAINDQIALVSTGR